MAHAAAAAADPGEGAGGQGRHGGGHEAHATPAEEGDGDGDGDELLEHWGDARYSPRAARSVVSGLTAFFGVFGAIASYRRRECPAEVPT